MATGERERKRGKRDRKLERGVPEALGSERKDICAILRKGAGMAGITNVEQEPEVNVPAAA